MGGKGRRVRVRLNVTLNADHVELDLPLDVAAAIDSAIDQGDERAAFDLLQGEYLQEVLNAADGAVEDMSFVRAKIAAGGRR